MDREIFIDKVISQSKKTEEDEILINAMSLLKSFFSSISDDFKKNNVDSDEYSTLFGSNYGRFKYREKNLQFDRNDYLINVKLNNSSYDELEIVDSKVISKKYKLELSNTLCEKYLDLFFD